LSRRSTSCLMHMFYHSFELTFSSSGWCCCMISWESEVLDHLQEGLELTFLSVFLRIYLFVLNHFHPIKRVCETTSLIRTWGVGVIKSWIETVIGGIIETEQLHRPQHNSIFVQHQVVQWHASLHPISCPALQLASSFL